MSLPEAFKLKINYWVIPGLMYFENFILDSDSIIDIVCGYFMVDFADLKKKHRYRRLYTARHFCFYFLRKYTDKSLSEIGILFRKDHSTIIHGVSKINGFLDIGDESTMASIHNIEELIRLSGKGIKYTNRLA